MTDMTPATTARLQSGLSLSLRTERCLSAHRVARFRRWLLYLSIAIASGVFTQPSRSASLPADVAKQVRLHIANERGLCVVVDDSQNRLIQELVSNELMIYAHFTKSEDAAEVRHQMDRLGLLGQRVFVGHGPATNLHLGNNLADALVALRSESRLTETEALRVLRPHGKAWLTEREVVKPPPLGTEDWSHPYHGPDNNPASTDRVAQGPYLTQFLADPRYAPLPQVAVASAGRVFKLFGHIAFKEREEPWLNTLAAFNGYNGLFLWRREVPAGIMVHRSTLIATPNRVYYADDRSCKVLDAASGNQVDEIAPPANLAEGTFWKWMALEDGMLFALVGADEQRDPVIRAKSQLHGWPWDPLSPGFNQAENPWGYGRTLLAIDPATKKVLWRHQEAEPMDSRALCLRNHRLFLFRPGSYLACLDTSTGRTIWRKTPDQDPEIFAALGPTLNRQDWRTNWRTTAYTKCSDTAIYFSGPTVSRLVALSAETGNVMWQHSYNNYQLVLQGGALYGLSGQIDREVSRKFDPVTGEVLAEIKLGRRACSRPTGALDAIFCRASGGSTRLDLESTDPLIISPMRAQCQDGVTIANGLLYWWPSVCDCNLTLYGITCLGPAGDFDYAQTANPTDRLELSSGHADTLKPLHQQTNDWPTFRGDNQARSFTSATLPHDIRERWFAPSPHPYTPTPPVAVADLVLVAGSDGVVRAHDAATGQARWRAHTDGAIRFPPTIHQDRAFVGSGDGWVYAWEAATGRRLWRFRAAPAERRIPVYGQLLSTWPAASGVLAAAGNVYVAAGLVNYDGTHVYALDAASGSIRWQNNTSGHLDPETLSGVSVQGHGILHDNQLWLAGGNAVSPARYDLSDGRCLNDLELVRKTVDNNVPASISPRGAELYLVANQVRVGGQPFYAHPKFKVYDSSVHEKTWIGRTADRVIAWVNQERIMAFHASEPDIENRLAQAWGKPQVRGIQPVWANPCTNSVAVALGTDTMVIASTDHVRALDVADGQERWRQPLKKPPIQWGLAIDRRGRIMLALEGGSLVCLDAPGSIARR